MQILEVNGLRKVYTTRFGGASVEALRNINFSVENGEYVAIMGESGSGKTTLLNILAGLDKPTSGSVLLDGKDLASIKEADRAAFRRDHLGFVFQEFNLLDTFSVEDNIYLPLVLAGVPQRELPARLEPIAARLGITELLKKYPYEISGGQKQRAAVARAIITNPRLLLADEPTGALDSETSVQVMELLKQIADEKLIIMVTHNPELAARYATRTVRLLDGSVLADSAPYEDAAEPPVQPESGKRRTSMSFFTALGLSLNNLMTKKARTILTAFAGSIGIIGIALILSLSNGIQTYINDVQEDTLSSYPVTIEAESADMSGMVTALMGVHSEEAGKTHTDGRVYASNVMYDLMQSLNENGTQTNDLEAFKRYLDNPDSEIHQYLTSIQYAYDLSLPVYTKDADDNIVKADVMDLLQNMMSSMYGGDYSSYFSQFGSYYSAMDVWEELLPDEDGTGISPLLKSQYDVLYGRWPESYDEVVLVVGENNEISDLVMYAMGLKTEQEMTDAMQAAMNQETIEKSDASWSYEELCGHTFQLILPFEHYAQNADGSWTDLSQSEAGMEYLYGSDEVGTTLKIVGVLRPDPDAANSMVRGSLGYTSALTQYVLDAASESAVIRQQLDDPETDVLTGLPFKTGDEETPDATQMREAVGAVMADADTQEKAQMYADMSKQAPGEYLDSAVQQAMDGMTRETIEAQMTDSYAGQMGTDPETVRGYIAQMDDETLFDYVRQMLREQIAAQYAEAVSAQLAGLSSEQLAAAMDAAELTDEQVQYLYDTYVPAAYSDSTLEDTLSALGYVERSKPSKVNLYASTFSDKDALGDCIERYNSALPEDDQITYTDYVALLMRSVTTIINAISYVLIAFVSISLVVSSIMIGIITYISVLERTKEIGILRAIGASKHDIARVFNAETLIEGLIAGLLGVGLTLVLILPINAVVQHLTDIASLGAKLPWQAGAALVAISMLLTFLAGLIPSSLAAKKDPVVALRTE